MKFGVALGRLNPTYFIECSLAADRLGYESIWLPEHLVFTTRMSRSPHPGEEHPPVPPTTPIFDAFAYLAYLAGRTERVRLGTHVYNIGLRHPFVAARAVQTLDIVSEGRVEFGVGASWLEEEWVAAELDFHRRGPSGRRGPRGVQAPLDRGRGLAPRRVLLLRRRRVRAQAGAAAVAADPDRRGERRRAAACRDPRRRLDRDGPRLRQRRPPGRAAARSCSRSAGRDAARLPVLPRRACRVPEADIARWDGDRRHPPHRVAVGSLPRGRPLGSSASPSARRPATPRRSPPGQATRATTNTRRNGNTVPWGPGRVERDEPLVQLGKELVAAGLRDPSASSTGRRAVPFIHSSTGAGPSST